MRILPICSFTSMRLAFVDEAPGGMRHRRVPKDTSGPRGRDDTVFDAAHVKSTCGSGLVLEAELGGHETEMR